MQINENDQFEELVKLYMHTAENYCLEKIKRAKDKTFMQGKLLTQVAVMLGAYSSGFQLHKKSFDFFMESYLSGLPVDDILTRIEADFPDSLNVEPVTGPRDEVVYIPFGEPEENLMKKFRPELQKMVFMYVGYFALKEVYKRIPDYLNDHSDVKDRSFSYPIQWTGTKDNKNEFVQLVYGLFKAKLINNGEGEITKITESLARAFKVDLSPNWQGNLSSSIHKSNIGYNPQVFDKINKAYQEYVKGQIEHKKKNQ